MGGIFNVRSNHVKTKKKGTLSAGAEEECKNYTKSSFPYLKFSDTISMDIQ